ncbi:MAG: prolipoprotein diacylglyceryl transferase [Candidatus Obscuribacterales bacterium]|nr:prolipoprotein diacylglyceryl transferase [Candidatus Obscuribacterales bacterium]
MPELRMPEFGTFLTALAYVVGACVYYFCSRKNSFTKVQSAWLLAAAFFGGLLGAKLLRLAFLLISGVSPAFVLTHPDGRTIIGGLLGGWLAVELMKKRLGIERSTGDAFALALASGEVIGRLGCYFSGCCYGIAAAALPWAVQQGGALRHPTQIYSSLTALATLLLLLFMRKRVHYEGDLFRIYFLLYGLSRFLLEFLRERSEVFFGLSMAQWVCLEISVSMAFAIAWLYCRKSEEDAKVHEP